MMLLLYMEVFSVGVLVGLAVAFLGFAFLRKHDDDSEDDLGYLENIAFEKGGVFDEVQEEV